MSQVVLKNKINAYPDLAIGSIGKITGQSKGMDCLLNVYFPHLNKTYQIIDRNLEIHRTPEEMEEWHKHLRSASNIIYTEGPMKGYKHLEYASTYPEKISRTIYDKKEGIKIMDFFTENNIPFTTNTLPKRTGK